MFAMRWVPAGTWNSDIERPARGIFFGDLLHSAYLGTVCAFMLQKGRHSLVAAAPYPCNQPHLRRFCRYAAAPHVYQ